MQNIIYYNVEKRMHPDRKLKVKENVRQHLSKAHKISSATKSVAYDQSAEYSESNDHRVS